MNSCRLSFNSFTSKGANTLFNFLRTSNSKIKKLVLDANKLGDGCTKSLGLLIQDQNGHVESISIFGGLISDDGVETLSEYLIGNTRLKELELHGNKNITDKSIPALKKIVDGSLLESLGVNQTAITLQNLFRAEQIHNQIKRGIKVLQKFSR